VLVVKATKNTAEALEFGIGQWLWFHVMTLVILVHSNIADD
jgi:hypothetical protein